MAVGRIFGGRFDPPHLGHLALARTAIDHFGLDELHVTVVADAAHKRSEASAEDRLAMARLTFAGSPRPSSSSGTATPSTRSRTRATTTRSS